MYNSIKLLVMLNLVLSISACSNKEFDSTSYNRSNYKSEKAIKTLDNDTLNRKTKTNY